MILKKQYPPTQIDEWLNQGQDFVVREARCLYGQMKATISAGDYWFKLPKECLDVLSIYWKQESQDQLRLKPKSQRQLDDEFQDWEVGSSSMHTGEPLYYVQLPQQQGAGSGHSIKLYPRNDKDGEIKVYFIRKATPMVLDADECSLEPYWYRVVTLFATYSALGDAKAMQELVMLIQRMKEEVKTKTTDAETFREPDRWWR